MHIIEYYVLTYNTDYNGYVEIGKVKCYTNVIISSHRALVAVGPLEIIYCVINSNSLRSL